MKMLCYRRLLGFGGLLGLLTLSLLLFGAEISLISYGQVGSNCPSRNLNLRNIVTDSIKSLDGKFELFDEHEIIPRTFTGLGDFNLDHIFASLPNQPNQSTTIPIPLYRSVIGEVVSVDVDVQLNNLRARGGS